MRHFLAFGIISSVSCFGVGVAIAASHTQSPTPNLVAQSYRSDSISFIWPARGTITQGFLPNISHMGIDIAGATGTPIVAAAGGRVIAAGWDDFGLGNTIKIEHSGGIYTVYGHNQRLWVREGQTVSQGQIVAEMGSTGYSSGPHLHFEIRQGGDDWVDPIAYLPPWVAGKLPNAEGL
jgi:lipoprotein NlpD